MYTCTCVMCTCAIICVHIIIFQLRRQGRFVAIVEWTLVNDNAQVSCKYCVQCTCIFMYRCMCKCTFAHFVILVGIQVIFFAVFGIFKKPDTCGIKSNRDCQWGGYGES